MVGSKRKLALWVAICGLAISLICAGRWIVSLTYLGFTLHGRTYYARIAAACDELAVRKAADSTSEWKILGRDPSLPAALRDLSLGCVLVNEQGVLLRMRTSLDTYAVEWYKVSGGANRWQLEGQPGGSRDVLFSTNKPPRPN